MGGVEKMMWVGWPEDLLWLMGIEKTSREKVYPLSRNILLLIFF